jgi:glucose-1-phosphate cytidylyltransferase
MKVVLFCGGLGTRIREYSENIPKPMTPIGDQPILRHGMAYYSNYGHTNFVLCMGYKANAIKEFFLTDCICSAGAQNVEVLGRRPADWRDALLDAGVWRNIGQRLGAVRDHVREEPMFLANYSDGLSDVDLDEMIQRFENSRKIAASSPSGCRSLTTSSTPTRAGGSGSSALPIARTSGSTAATSSTGRRSSTTCEGEELVLEPFERLIASDLLMAYKYEGFWRSMDTLRDWQSLQDLVERGETPWLQSQHDHSSVGKVRAAHS